MYKVIEFEDNGLAIVREGWLTPRKKECLWPPYKVTTQFNKCLVTQDIPDENWPLFSVRRILYETDNIQIARQKCKKAESESDLLSESEQFRIRKKRKPNNEKFIHSDTDEEEEADYIPFKYPNPPETLPEVNVEPHLPPSPLPCSWDNTSLQSPAINVENLLVPEDSQPRNNYSPSFAHTSKTRLMNVDPLLISQSPCTTTTESKPSTLDKINDSLGIIATYIAGIQSDIKELKAVQNDILLRLTSSPSAALTTIALPEEITLPMKSIEDVDNIEVWLENDGNKENLIHNLSFIGGNNVATITRRILQRLFSSELALKFNWTGKNNKKSLKNLQLIPVIINAVRKNKLAEKATDSDITSSLTSWFRFARDRDGGRDNRRARNSQ